ncbi:MAG: DUF2721 domain-containing protein [candidate division NC10 bacterium]|uniref:DUF2721 domain-containing protein n=1 Tax=Tectimicrobiota bacterium TaxID=2528274 RepID=A0A932I2X9_UNCTE|nr:DUF2721 domain-containing protein [candidate division NC10 bacterium]MBI3128361.1 DUF2721 domain-containing protein [Candidatus Tectomicrobia bacterium]
MTGAQLVAALLSPAIFISAAGLLALSINTRMMGIITRLRGFHWERHQKERLGEHAEAQVLDRQIEAVTRHVIVVRNALLWVLASIILTLATCLLLGLAVLWPPANGAAIFCFVLAFLAMLAGMGYYVRDISMALDAARDEERVLAQIRAERRGP